MQTASSRIQNVYKHQLQTIRTQLTQVSSNQEAILAYIHTLPADEKMGSVRKALAAMYNSLLMLNSVCVVLSDDVKTN